MSIGDVMTTNDAPLAKLAKVYVTLGQKRYAMLMCKDFEGKVNITTKDVPRLGSVIIGKKPTSATISFKMVIYKCTEIFDDVIEQFISTGVMPELSIQISNEDPATSVGRTSKVFNDCVLDGDVLLAMAKSEDDYIEQEISGYAGGIARPEKYKNPSYM